MGKDFHQVYQEVQKMPHRKEVFHPLLEDEPRLHDAKILLGGSLGEFDNAEDCERIFGGISKQIESYAKNEKTKGEMLPKTPQQLEDIFRAGRSAIILDSFGVPVAHAAAWELIDGDKMGTPYDIDEFGSWIVGEKEMRNHGLGEMVALALVDERKEQGRMKGKDVEMVATVKRAASLSALERIGLTVESFAHIPLIAALTCVCTDTSEHTTDNKTCPARRDIAKGEEIVFDNGKPHRKIDEEFYYQNGNSSPKLPCTLVVSNRDRFRAIEEDLQSRYVHVLERPFDYNVEDGYHSGTAAQARLFYDSFGVHII